MTITRWDAFGNMAALHDQVNRLFENNLQGSRSDNSALTTWAPAVDIYEDENALVLKADLPDLDEKDLDIRVENNMLTVRGERKFEQEGKRRELPSD
jgi:HSP20 family protein